MSLDLTRALIKPDKICWDLICRTKSGNRSVRMLEREDAGTLSRLGVGMRWPDRITVVFRPGGLCADEAPFFKSLLGYDQ
jgi:hypothetical protein